MNSKNFFNLSGRCFAAASLSCILALSLALCNSCQSAPPAKAPAPAKPKSDKSPKSNSEPEKKDDKAKEGDKSKEAAAKPEVPIENVVAVSTDDLVEKPHEYLGKNVKFSAPFFAFSNLALDYKPAYRSPKTHISILVTREKKKIPLSELKLAMMTPKDEKGPETQLLSQLKEGDVIEVTGKVFSTALDDPWVDILRLKKISSAPDDKKADASSKEKKNDTKSAEKKDDKSSAGKSESNSK